MMTQSPKHPYSDLPDKAYWKRAVAARSCFGIEDVYAKKFDITSRMRVSAAGSCFAQHISRHLRANGFIFNDVEPRPLLLPAALAQTYGYEIYSGRFGNIYTARQLRQLLERATGDFVPDEDVWVSLEGRYFDPFRPTIEPNGFASRDELVACRRSHLDRVVQLMKATDLFVFTFGLTEAWHSRKDGAVFPLCPGTAAGTWNSERYEFKNFTFGEILADIVAFIRLANTLRPGMKFLFTVSPVPLVATATGDHVLVATTAAKSTLRAVARELTSRYQFVDYFPSYEIVTAPMFRGIFYEADMRSVSAPGVSFVMEQFFKSHKPVAKKTMDAEADEEKIPHDVVCDEIILQAQAG